MRKLCDEHDAVFIMDDIRSTLRIDIRGTWEQFGVHPDLCCQCKGIANGQPLAAIIGVEKLRAAAAKVTATGSFWASAVPFAAALATIDVLEHGGIEQVRSRVGPELGPTSAVSSGAPTGTHGPTCIFWTDLTACSPQ